ncbi:MAG: putative quinol monooxygenase [Actinomycetota bacterium]
MYGTVANARVKPGHIDQLQSVMAEWERDFGGKDVGEVASLVYRLDADPNSIILVAAFTDKATYVKNADSPEQDKWFQRLREHLEADPEWNDGEIVHSAGF